jgi:hypothetical protein
METSSGFSSLLAARRSPDLIIRCSLYSNGKLVIFYNVLIYFIRVFVIHPLKLSSII